MFIDDRSCNGVYACMEMEGKSVDINSCIQCMFIFINPFIIIVAGNITIGEESCNKGELYCYALMPYCLLYETKIWLTYY